MRLFILSLLILCITASSGVAKRHKEFSRGEVMTNLPGKVKRMHMNLQGELDGFYFETGTLVRVPKHLSQQLASVVHSGDELRVEGSTNPEGVVRALSITNLTNHRRLATETITRLKPITTEGRIERVFRGKRGEVREVVMSDGSIIKIPREAQTEFSELLREGELIAATGFGTENEYGRSFEANALGVSLSDLRPVFSDRTSDRPGAE